MGVLCTVEGAHSSLGNANLASIQDEFAEVADGWGNWPSRVLLCCSCQSTFWSKEKIRLGILQEQGGSCCFYLLEESPFKTPMAYMMEYSRIWAIGKSILYYYLVMMWQMRWLDYSRIHSLMVIVHLAWHLIHMSLYRHYIWCLCFSHVIRYHLIPVKWCVKQQNFEVCRSNQTYLPATKKWRQSHKLVWV